MECDCLISRRNTSERCLCVTACNGTAEQMRGKRGELTEHDLSSHVVYFTMNDVQPV